MHHVLSYSQLKIARREDTAMNYLELFDLFHQCRLGAVLAARDDIILDINQQGDIFLNGKGNLKGQSLRRIADFLCISPAGQDFIPSRAGDGVSFRCTPVTDGQYGNPAFHEYLLPVCVLESGLFPAQSRMVVFRDATSQFFFQLLEHVFHQMNEAVTIWDNQCRILMINKAAEKLESHLSDDVLGKENAALYKANKNSILAIPQVLKDKKPLLNLRQDVFTNSGKEIEMVSSNYPVLMDGRVVAAYSMMQDHSSITELHHRIGELQRTLADTDPAQTPKTDSGLTAHYNFSDICFTSNSIRILIERSKMIALSDSPVLIYGETGTGKELFAQSIHNASRRKHCPFLAINCAAIPETLLESTLFGTEKGAYTGSIQRKGLLELAHTGTLLLDEINSMDIQLQAKLLRFLQEGEFRRVGGVKSIHVDVRIISNTNIAPMEAIQKKQLRIDLYYRLGIANLTIPPLRERKEDIPTLVQSFLLKARKATGKSVLGIDKHTLSVFFAYDWPGNIRELQHAIEYSMTILPFDLQYITPEYLPDHILDATAAAPAPVQNELPKENLVRAATRKTARTLIQQTLAEHQNNISESAKALGISRQNLQRYIKSLDL